MKQVRYAIEALGLCLLLLIFRLMPVDIASGVGGWLGRMIGPHLATSRKALRHIQRALPELSPEEHKQAIIDMWDTLGRIIAEYPHLEYIARNRTLVSGQEPVKTLAQAQKPAVLFGAHLANWETNCMTLELQGIAKMDVTYRAPNNPWSDKILRYIRTRGERIPAHAKSRVVGKKFIEALKAGRMLGVLVDQKFNEGMPASFFGMTAMTNTIFIHLAQKYNTPLFPVQVVRTHGAHFEYRIHEPLTIFEEDGTPRPVDNVLADVNSMIESWIRENPGQWLWLHRRWSEEALAGA